MIRTIPLNKLVQSSRNVRKHSDAAADAEAGGVQSDGVREAGKSAPLDEMRVHDHMVDQPQAHSQRKVSIVKCLVDQSTFNDRFRHRHRARACARDDEIGVADILFSNGSQQGCVGQVGNKTLLVSSRKKDGV